MTLLKPEKNALLYAFAHLHAFCIQVYSKHFFSTSFSSILPLAFVLFSLFLCHNKQFVTALMRAQWRHPVWMELEDWGMYGSPGQ